MNRLIFASLWLALGSAAHAEQSPLPGRYFTPASLTAQMNRPNDQVAEVYLMGAYDSTQDAGQSCAARGTTTPVLLAKVFSDYLTAHPDLAAADRTAAGVAAQAFSQYWPCHSASQSPTLELPTIPDNLDRGFICPETLPNDQARAEALRAFFTAVRSEAPHATILDAVHFRYETLQKHGCRQTLQQMQAAAAPSSDPPGEITWLPVPFGGAPGETLAISDIGLVPVVDPRWPAEHAVKAYVKLTFPSAQESNPIHVNYDTVISHNIYYCESGRYALIENDYFLSGKPAFQDPSPATHIGSTDVYEITPVRPGSPNEAAVPPACRAIGVVSAPAAPLPGRYFTADSLAAQTSRGNDPLARIYLMGAYDLTQDARQSCAQRGTTTPVLLEKVYSDYLQAHPGLMHTDRTAAATAAQAFAQYWPCSH